MEKLFNKKWDTAIIGGGIAGLTAALFLAKANKKVVVLEKAKRLGGRAMTETKEGCSLNLGPHALYKKGEGLKICHELGITLKGGTPNVKGTIVVEDRLYKMPVSPLSLVTSKLLSWKEKKEFVQLMLNVCELHRH